MHNNLYRTRPAYSRVTTALTSDPQPAARGRNGWFTPTRIDLWQGETIRLLVWSRRVGDYAPIQLHISPEIAHALARRLLVAASGREAR